MATVGKLTMEAPGDREIVITRTFDAPRQMVFDAFTRPELVPQWLTGPPGSSMPICEIDLRAGGAYRYVLTGPGHPEMTIRGVFKQIVPPERVVATESFDPAWYEGENINTTTFTESGGKTTVTLRIECASKASRDGMLKTGMERGLAFSYDRLEAVLQGTERTKAS